VTSLRLLLLSLKLPRVWSSIASWSMNFYTWFFIDVIYEHPPKKEYKKNLNKIASTLYWMDLWLKGKNLEFFFAFTSFLCFVRKWKFMYLRPLIVCFTSFFLSHTLFFVCNSFVKFVALGIGSLLFLTHWNVPNFNVSFSISFLL